MPNFQTRIKVFGDPEYYCNSLVFATYVEASAYGAYKLWSWTLADKYKVTETEDPVNYEFKNDSLRRIDPAPAPTPTVAPEPAPKDEEPNG